MTEIIDYAGLFPPAKLEMDEAISNYIRHRKEKQNWMLGRFICPSSRLSELERGFQKFEDKGPFRISVLGHHKKDNTNFLDNLYSDLKSIKVFLKNTEKKFAIDIIETRLPPKIFQTNNPNNVRQMLEDTDRLIESAGLGDVSLFFEITYPKGWQDILAMVVKEFSLFSRRSLAIKRVGIKLRCGRPFPAAFLEPFVIALVIRECRDAIIPLKATAGLHHPIIRFNKKAKTMEHGFLNLFAAGILALVHGFNEDRLTPILEDQNPENFVFDNSSFGWKSFRASIQEIDAARRTLMDSFGSCSFDEPNEELKKLGLF